MHRLSLAQQCKGTTRRGNRCSLTSAKPFLDSDGKDVTLPLKLGCDDFLMHLPMLVTTPTSVVGALVLYFDFETSGLDVLSDQIVEIGLLSEQGQCFSTVVRPPVLKPGPHVHGIDNEELSQGSGFAMRSPACLISPGINAEEGDWRRSASIGIGWSSSLIYFSWSIVIR